MAKANKNGANDAGETAAPVAAPAPARELKFGEGDNAVVVAWDSVPEGNRFALAQRTFSHIFGNEFASAAKGAKERAEKDKKDFDEADFAKGWREAKVKLLTEGELGVRVGGTRATTLDKEIRDIAVKALRQIAESKKAKLPAKADDLNAMIDKWLAVVEKKSGEPRRVRVTAEAQAAIDSRKAMALEADDDALFADVTADDDASEGDTAEGEGEGDTPATE